MELESTRIDKYMCMTTLARGERARGERERERKEFGKRAH